MFEVRDLSFSFDGKDSVLRDFSLSLKAGEIISLLGPSGCGKSTVLRLVAGLLLPQQGNIEWEADPSLGFVFQDHALMPWATVEENVALPGRLRGHTNKTKIADALESVGMAGFEGRYPAELSGGQRMRVSLARALAADASLLLMDEPFAALDEILRFQMNELLLKLKKERGFSVLFVTHSVYEAVYLSDQIAVMNSGVISDTIPVSLDRSLPSEEQKASSEFIKVCQKVSRLMQEGGK